MIEEKVLAAEAFIKAVTEEDIPEEKQLQMMAFLLNDKNYPMPIDVKVELKEFVKSPPKQMYHPRVKTRINSTGWREVVLDLPRKLG
jgi:hypothetical protein